MTRNFGGEAMLVKIEHKYNQGGRGGKNLEKIHRLDIHVGHQSIMYLFNIRKIYYF